MKNLTIILIAIQLVLVSCENVDNALEKKESGYFVIAELNNSLKSVNTEPKLKSAQTNFNLGDLKASMQYSFILLNGGDQPIFDIVLNTDNSAFTLSPNAISLIVSNPNPDKISNIGFIPIISLEIIHGIHINGVGVADILPMGINTSKISIKGKTIDGNDTIEISSDFDFTVNAKVMDIKLYADGSEIDLTKNDGGSFSTLGGLGSIRRYEINSSNFEIENIGNVVIDLTYGHGYEDNKHLSLEPNDKKQINDSWSPMLSLDGNGTITDNNRIQLGNDGIGYLKIVSPTISLP